MGVFKNWGGFYMAYIFPSEGSLDYYPCLYGSTRVHFRGPRRDIDNTYVAVIGGTETYGKFVPVPYPDLLEHRLGMPVVNLGSVNAGPDLYLNEEDVAKVAQNARLTVVQVMGAHNISNRYYKVHPRRNDRFLGASAGLRAIFPQVDFTEFNFTRHMLMTLQNISRDRFEVIAEELRSAWVSRMLQLLSRLRGPTVLLWMSEQSPPTPEHRVDMALNPLLVDSEMIAALLTKVARFVEVVYRCPTAPVDGMVFAPLEAIAAAGLPGPMVHKQVVDQLMPVLRDLL